MDYTDIDICPLIPEKTLRVERIASENMEGLMREGSAFRKTVRGEATGRLE